MILIPMGSCEQHGAHLPVGMDYIYPEGVARRAAEKADILYTPTVWMGYSPQHLRGAGEGMGTISIRPETLGAILYDVARSLVHQGLQQADIRQRPRLQRQDHRPDPAPDPRRHRRPGGLL